jgi:hypothetical protein
MHTRKVLASVVALGTLILFVVLGSLPTAGATQGQAVIAGATNTETFSTDIFNTTGSGSCSGQGKEGLSVCGDPAIVGEGTTRGVVGEASGTGVEGHSTGTGNGVYGRGGLTGVYGQGSENGVQAKGGTFGVFAEGSDYGVFSIAPNHGVYGQSTSATGVGVDAAASGGGTALRVTGKARFNRSGTVTITNAASKTVTLAGVTTASMILATAQQNRSVSVKAAVPGSGSFTIYLTGTAPSTGLKVAYFVLN